MRTSSAHLFLRTPSAMNDELNDLITQILEHHPAAQLLLAALSVRGSTEVLGPQAGGFDRELARDLRQAADLIDQHRLSRFRRSP
jgi:hypothetical protein